MTTKTIEITEGGAKILIPAGAFTARVSFGATEVKTAFATHSVSETLSALKSAANTGEVNVIEVTDAGETVLIPARNFTASNNGSSRTVKTAWTTLNSVSQTLAQLESAANA